MDKFLNQFRLYAVAFTLLFSSTVASAQVDAKKSFLSEVSAGGLSSYNEIAALCFWCHYEIDQGKELSKEERKNRWEQAHLKTLQSLATAGLWPEEIPFTDQYLRIAGKGASFCDPPCG